MCFIYHDQQYHAQSMYKNSDAVCWSVAVLERMVGIPAPSLGIILTSSQHILSTCLLADRGIYLVAVFFMSGNS